MRRLRIVWRAEQAVGAVADHLAALSDEDRPAIARVFAVAQEIVPEAVEGTSYGMPALLYRGRGLVAAVRRTRFLSLYPYSGTVVGAVAGELTGFEHTSGSIHFTRDEQIPDAVLRRIVLERRREIDSALLDR